MFCLKCGSQQADDARFCGACGARLAGVFGPQPEPAVSVPATTAPSKAGVPAPLDAPAADSSLTVEEWSVTCAPPDSDGDVRVEAKVRGEYRGAASAHVARLSWIVFDPTGLVPLLQGDNTLSQDIDDEDTVEVEASGCGKLGEEVAPDACQVRGQVVLYTGEKQSPWTISLPEAGQTGGKGPAWPHAGAEVSGWRVSCSESSEESSSYILSIVVRNSGPQALAAVTFRLRVNNRKGDVWSTEYLVAERLAAEEMQVLETTLCLSERARARRGAAIELAAIVSPRELVCPLTPACTRPQEPEQAPSGAEPRLRVVLKGAGFMYEAHEGNHNQEYFYAQGPKCPPSGDLELQIWVDGVAIEVTDAMIEGLLDRAEGHTDPRHILAYDSADPLPVDPLYIDVHEVRGEWEFIWSDLDGDLDIERLVYSYKPVDVFDRGKVLLDEPILSDFRYGDKWAAFEEKHATFRATRTLVLSHAKAVEQEG